MADFDTLIDNIQRRANALKGISQDAPSDAVADSLLFIKEALEVLAEHSSMPRRVPE